MAGLENLRTIISALSSRPLQRIELDQLVSICHDLALVRVKNRITAFSLQSRFQFSSFSDLAYDCIADLFLQDERGNHIQLKSFFDGTDLSIISDEQLLVNLRRLVFSRVQHGIFRILNEIDPQLGRLIRSIKLASEGLPNFSLVEKYGEMCLIPSSGESLEHLPAMDIEKLEMELAEAVNRENHVPSMLASLSRFLSRQTDFSRVVPVVRLAIAIRNRYVRKHEDGEPVAVVDENLTHQEAGTILSEVSESIRRQGHEKYVIRKKIPATDFENYMSVIETMLTVKYVHAADGDASLFGCLQKFYPSLDRSAYKKQHRARLEYLYRIADQEANRRLRARFRQ